MLKDTVLSLANDLSGGTVTNNSTSYTQIVTYSYTPVSTSSYLVIEFICRYYITGSGGDTWNSRITVDSAEIGMTTADIGRPIKHSRRWVEDRLYRERDLGLDDISDIQIVLWAGQR